MDTLQNIKTTWDFVEKYYPNYHGDGLIDYSNVLTCYVNEEPTNIETVEEAICIFDKNFSTPGGNSNDLIENFEEYEPIAQKALNYIDGLIYKTAIAGYIENQLNLR